LGGIGAPRRSKKKSLNAVFRGSVFGGNGHPPGFKIQRWKRKQRKRVFVLVDSFEIYQPRSVLVGWVVGVGGCPAVPSFPAQTKGRFRKHESTRTEGRHAQKHAHKHAQKAHKSTTEGTESRKAREHKSTRAQEQRNTSEPNASETLCALITAAQRHYPESSTHRERAEKAGCPVWALLVWVLLTAIGRKICVGSYAG
jgi:hypothetical protein